MEVPILLRLSIRFCLLACCFVTACHSADGFLRKELSVAGRIQSVTIGDFNGDFRPDFAVRTLEDLSVLLNTGAGDFSSPIRTALPYGSASAFVTDYGVGRTDLAADFNGDSKLDLAIKDRNEILFGAGDGNFLPPQVISGEYPSFYGLTTTGDFNGDQKPDLVYFVRGSLAILIGNGDGTFRAGYSAELGGDGQLVASDFNRDGWSDLVYFRYQYPSGLWDPNCCDLRIFLGKGDGSFEDAIPISGIAPGSILVADFNADGIPDISTVNAMLLGKGDGSFQFRPTVLPGSPEEQEAKMWYQTPAGPVAAGDLDGDGHVDVVEFGSTEGRHIFARKGRGDGTFGDVIPRSPPDHNSLFTTWETGPIVDARAGGVVDLDGDGRLDVVTAVYCTSNQFPYFSSICLGGPNNLTILLNRIDLAAH